MHTLEERALREPLITFLTHTSERMNIMNKRNEYEKTMHALQPKRVVALQGQTLKRAKRLPALMQIK